MLVGDAVRLSVSLVAFSPERTLWSDSYDQSLGDVLTLMRTITSDVATEIALTLTQGERARLAEARPIDPGALDAYLRGRFHWSQRSVAGFRLASNYFSRAIGIDSGYAAAWAGLSDTYNMMAQYNIMSLEEAIPAARQAAERAFAADSTMAEAYTSLGEVYFVSREWRKAETAFRQSIALDPRSAEGHKGLGWFLSHVGRHEEALEHLAIAAELDPLVPATHGDYAAALINAGRIDDAFAQVQRVLDLQPDPDSMAGPDRRPRPGPNMRRRGGLAT